MPWGWIEAFSEEIDKIEAREALRLATAVGLGSGSVPKQQASRILSTWNRLAGYERVQRVDMRTAAGRAALSAVMAVDEVPTTGPAPLPLADIAGYRARIFRDRERVLGVSDGRQARDRGT